MNLTFASPASSPHGAISRRRFGAGAAALALVGALALAGCASMNTVQTQVSSYGTWSTETNKPGRFLIERTPSQQGSDDPALKTLEAAVSDALVQAGFAPAAAGTTPDYTVQIGARISRNDRAPWDDPLWWNAWGPRWSSLAWYQPGWRWGFYGYAPSRPEYLREVGVLLRSRSSGQALYEARAHSDGGSQGSADMLGAMARAALQGFPAVSPEPRTVTVQIKP